MAQLFVVATGDREQRDVRTAHHRVRAGEQQGLIAERSRNAQRCYQQTAIATNIARRTPPSSGSITLVSQA